MRFLCLAATAASLIAVPVAAQPLAGAEQASSARGTPRRSARAAIVYAQGPADPAAIARAWANATAQPPLSEAAWQARAARAELRLPGAR